MPRGAQSAGLRRPGPAPPGGLRVHGPIPGPAPPAGLRAQGPTPVIGLTGIVARGGSHRRALSFPQYSNAQNIRSPSPSPPQSESNDLHYPTQAALNKFANMGTTFTIQQYPPPPSSCDLNL